MNKTRRSLSSILMTLVLAFTMIFAMTTTAFANNATDTTISVPSTDTHTYEVYQIFTGELNDGVLSNVEWGVNGSGYVSGATTSVSDTILKELAAIDANASDTTKLTTIEKYVNLKTDPNGTVKAGTSLTVKTGYYLLKDVDTDITGSDTFTKYVVQVVGPTTVSRKAATPEMVKKVKETNDSTNTVSNWQDASDYDIGDDVPYQIKTTIVSNYAQYEHYYLAFNDTMDAGLTFNNDVKVYVNGTEISGFTTVTGEDAGEYTFVTFCLDITKLTYGDGLKIKAGDVITVEYSAKLNENAVLGSTGNKNTANMEFSNNPNNTGDGTKKPDKPGETPKDTVITFTYKTVVNKIHQTGTDADGKAVYKPLAGAAFKLQKYNGTAYVDVKAFTADDAGTTFTFTGLDAGKYQIVETTTPPGYNTIDPVQFEVKSTFGTENASDNLDLKSLTVVDANGNALSNFTIEMTTGTTSTYTGVISTDIENKKGSTLPSTGGMGTTLFYVIGAILVLGAGVILVTRRRMESK